MKSLVKNLAICAAVGSMLAACGGGSEETSSSNGTKLLAASPGSNFSLGGWSLQLPTGSPGSPDTISGSALEGGYTSKYFYTATDGSMAFWCPEKGVTTPNATHTRTELRHNSNWSLSGTHTLSATLKVVKVPSNTTIGQIHIGSPKNGAASSSKPTVELYYHSNGDVVVGIEDSPSGGQTAHTVGHAAIGSKFTYQIKTVGNVATVTVNGTPHSYTLNSAFSNYTHYFKAGNYIQSASNSTTVGALVQFYALTVN